MPKCPKCKAEIKTLWRFVKTELKLVVFIDAQGDIQQQEQGHEDECESYICPDCQADLPISDFTEAVGFLRGSLEEKIREAAPDLYEAAEELLAEWEENRELSAAMQKLAKAVYKAKPELPGRE